MTGNDELINQHETYWGEYTQTQESKYLLMAAVQGHYRAISHLAGDSNNSETIDQVQWVLRKNQEWQNYKHAASPKEVEAIKKSIQEKNQLLSNYIEKNKKLPSKEDLYKMMHIQFTFTSWAKKVIYVIRTSLSFLGNLFFGRNTFLSQKQQMGNFDKKLKKSDFKFKEIRTQNNNNGIILEALEIERSSSETNNVIIYLGGRSDNFTYSISGILDQFNALDKVDKFYCVNPRNVSLSAGLVSIKYQDMVDDFATMVDAIAEQNQDANITLYGMCAGSPVACKTAADKELKFFSDRSFQSCQHVFDGHMHSSWYMQVIAYVLFPFSYMLSFLFHIWDIEVRQNREIKKIKPHHRLCHSIAVKKGSNRLGDAAIRGKKAALQKAGFIKKEDEQFDELYINICKKILGKSLDSKKKRDWLGELDQSNEQDDIKTVMKEILYWHKDRKSQSQPDKSKGLNPHVLFFSFLNGRGSGQNPIYRLNSLAAMRDQEFPSINNQDLVKLIENHIRPFACHNEDLIKTLDERISSTLGNEMS